MEIKLSKEIAEKVSQGHIKTVEVIQYIIDNVAGATTEKEINKTALKDISFNGKYPVSGMFNTYKGTLILNF